ncbi:related to SOK1 protein [Sporisorium reilianum SRZ2]|uniref:Related to SOK1 protein n=1 Tax=Sporisorium reilianum (strain SRZ2) TaxID=999809 RepID=E6ZQS5_SPORE|nr:related to SOK1 protein [Sporisorium reilianum SRZ2]
MDASADDPQRFRVRRSPSIGSAAAPVTSAVRAGKRKLSTAAFGSSPSMAPHPPSSPITSEHPTDDLELKLTHGLQSTPHIASTSRSTIDTTPDSARPSSSEKAAASNVHPSSSAHTHFADWQEQRRCHSILADYDFSPPAEDRRDPRTCNGRIVMPVPSSQSQVMVASSAHGSASNGSDPHASLQHPPIASHHDETDLDAAHASPLPSASSTAPHDEANCQPTAPRFAPFQSSLSQTSLSVPPSPERGISPSSSFSAFDYQAPHSRAPPCFPAPAPNEPQPHTLEQMTAAQVSQSLASEASGASTGLQASQNQTAEPVSKVAPSAAASARPWSRVSSQHLAPQAASSLAVPAQGTAASQREFQLQPVPLAKRRRVEDGSVASADNPRRDPLVQDETRRFSDAGLPLRSVRIPNRPQPTEARKSAVANSGLPSVSSKTSLKYTSSHIKAAGSTTLSSAASALASSRARNDADAAASSEARPSVRSEKVAALPSVAPSRKQQTPFSRRMSRLVRAQSVPNLRVKATLDLSAPSHHRLVLPSHWASYVSSHARQGREGANAKTSNTRSSKGSSFNVAHYPVASGSSRSRSTFTPTLHPPITRHTLRELDLFEILKNPQLRHDVVFDPNVQFRPNFDGERGRRKREAGERYWTAVVREIETGCTCTAFSHGQLLPCTCKAKHRLRRSGAAGTQDAAAPLQPSRIPSRIPLLVQELRTICLSILPSNYPADSVVADAEEAATTSAAEDDDKGDDAALSEEAATPARKKATVAASSVASWTTTHHQLIAQTLDPHLISQQLQHGVLDVPALITFMGSILKLHCAPMRDEAIERMVDVVCVDRNIGKGLRLCFEILELMKLDIANHQLRSARPFLVETAVDFEIRWFKEQIEQGKMSLERTTAWIQQALGSSPDAATATPRSEAVVKAFNKGMLQLIFDVPGSLPLVSPVATPLGSPSSSSLNNTFASYYPETFQFDAYRMMTFHNDVSDLTIVYMLVLLFRQLCSMPLDGGEALPASVGSIVQNQLKSIKGEIWCLVNDANLCLSSWSALPPTPTAASGATSPTRRPTAVDGGKLFVGSAGGFAKLDHPRWRRAMQNVLLQVAARAAAVQTAARAGSSDPSAVKMAAPSTPTQKLLNSWMDTNLRSGSALHKICQNRLRDVVLGMLGDKVRNGLQPSTSAVAAPCATATATGATGTGQKRAVPGEPQDAKVGDATPNKKLRSDGGGAAAAAAAAGTASTPTVACSSSGSAASAWDTAMSRAGLEPFAAEIRLLSDRIAKVATLHLRVFRNLYEGIESGRHTQTGSGGAQ